MARLGRKGRILKWAGLVLSLVIVVGWVVSLKWRWDYGMTRSTGSVQYLESRRDYQQAVFDCELVAGSLCCTFDFMKGVRARPGFRVSEHRSPLERFSCARIAISAVCDEFACVPFGNRSHGLGDRRLKIFERAAAQLS